MILLDRPPTFAAPDSPHAELAALVGGEIVGWSSVRVGDRFITTGVTGVVRLGRVVLGVIGDGAERLAAAYWAEVR